jgi:hypothetical protein
MDRERSIGLGADGENTLPGNGEIEKIKLQLLLLGFPVENLSDYVEGIVEPVITQILSPMGELRGTKCKADERIMAFCRRYLADVKDFDPARPLLPDSDFICDRHGVARLLSLPEKADEFHCEYVDSYRTCNGILHNPSTDKRTTKDVFHVVEGGCPVPSNKKEVPKIAFANMLWLAFHPDDGLLTLPFTAGQSKPAKVFVSNYMRPMVCPKVEGLQDEKRMEIRFFIPGSLVSILDCAESIFGNAGSPLLPENDAALDPLSWSGHTGCIVFAPQLRKCTKKSLGLPHASEATERQKADGMCWTDDLEPYHDGKPFKVVARDGSGVIVSIIADTYNGYGKKEIKTQVSYAANMLGLCEEEHSGGTLVFPRYDLGDEFNYSGNFGSEHGFENTLHCCAGSLHMRDGFAVDARFANVIYVPEYANFRLRDLSIAWENDGRGIKIPIEFGNVYVLPSGYRVHLEKPDARGGRWKMIGTVPNGLFCYKPSTVSGGGKSEIAKSVQNFISSGPTIVYDYETDCKLAKEIIAKDYSKRFRSETQTDSRSILDTNRSLGSTIKLFTASDFYTDEYNAWLKTTPQHILELIFTIKRFSKYFSGEDWQQFFSVDRVNDACGNELRYNGEKLFEHYLRVGLDRSNHWRLFSLRDDFIPATKLQLADDITVTTVVPAKNIPFLRGQREEASVKVVHNCEHRLYQRPDEAIVPGYDPESEADLAGKNIFACNFRALSKEAVREMIRNRITFEAYSDPLKRMLENFVADEKGPSYAICPSELRTMGDGRISKNQRYLQNRSDIRNGMDTYLAGISSKLWRKFSGPFEAVNLPVDTILSGRRNNPPEDGIRPLCVYNPLHYMDLPELFLEFTASITGKSPSTTGAGSEGAMTKDPFNCLSSVHDLNNALLSFILTGYHGFLSAAGYVGPWVKVDHDVTYLLPEIWCRMTAEERNPKFLIDHQYLERCENFQHDGHLICAERLGYRITKKFVRTFAGRVFPFPDTIFSDEMLRPEMQDMAVFADSMGAIVDAHQRAASMIFDSEEIKLAIPPLRALLGIAAHGSCDGMGLGDRNFRAMFRRENVIGSDWYLARLRKYQASQIEHLTNGIAYVKDFENNCPDGDEAVSATKRIEKISRELDFVKSDAYLSGLIGTLGK